ncbi:hypothetical protein [uncultured Desulfobacter sp.]|uniref:hypothetical protein n=1 Tax=uncultured Desulfobacter sp. TaxID=240139 RepID=UPI0029F58434|nr:hypothetical protein [uncultured Desulfobacter sp.]
METADYFRKAIKDYLNDKPRGAQAKLARDAGIDKIHLNDFLGKRRVMQEKDRIKITTAIGVDYLEFLQHGKKMLCGDVQASKGTAILSLEKKKIDVTKNFKKKDRAIRINKKLAYAEQLDEDSLDKIERQIDLELEDLEKRVGIKKKPTANGEK